VTSRSSSRDQIERERLARAFEAEERTARHLAQLNRMAELGLKLTTAAAEQAMRHPCIHEASPVARGTDPHKMFERLSSEMRRHLAFTARYAKRHLPADQADTSGNARYTAVLDWLDSEIAAFRQQGPSAPEAHEQDGKPAVHGLNPN